MKCLRSILVALASLGVFTAVWAAESANKVGGGYLVYPNKQGTAIFSHLSHGETGAGFKCADCHPAMAMKKGSFKMADIYAGKACAICHNGQTKAPKSGAAAFAVTTCAGCHMPDKDLVRETKGPGAVAFSHAKHTGLVQGGKTVENAGYSCGSCHPKLFKAKAGEPLGMAADPHTKGGCAECHDGKHTSPSGAVAKPANANCTDCHQAGK
ncbi:MAG: hypothetical protein HY321_10040 [Armatimonadetes bacterium]|nr:hypothetical protein [Armatimonadota bacterium]